MNEHSLQAPFIYELFSEVLQTAKKASPDYRIEELRKTLLNSKENIEIKDFGAGSSVQSGNKRAVSSIARHGITKKKYSVLLSQLIEHLNYTSIIELGTALGINTLYLAQKNDRRVLTLEGDPTLADMAKTHFEHYGSGNIKVITGRIEATLSQQLASMEKVDFAFVDAHHNYDATLQNFNTILNHLNPTGCVVFDDIHWSNEMERAWKKIISMPQVTLSFDIYQMGFVFINPDYGKQHYILAY